MLLRHALGYLTRALRDPKFNSHVIKQMHLVAFSDTESEYGSRHANKGNLQLLEGFDLNHELSLERALPVRLEHSLDMTTGTIQLRVPSCIVRRKKVLPAGATHFKIVSCAAALNFDRHRYTNTIAESELLPLSKQVQAVELEHSLVGKPGQVMVHTVGMVFYKVEEGKVELLRGGMMRVVEVVRIEVLQSPLAADPVVELPMRETLQGIRNFVMELEADVPGSEVATPALVMNMPVLEIVAPMRVIGRVRCAPCTLHPFVFPVEEEARAIDELQEVLPGNFLGISPETDDFAVGISDAMGVPLQDQEVPKKIQEDLKRPRKQMRLSRDLRRRQGTKTLPLQSSD
jgi:hypothetical protein